MTRSPTVTDTLAKFDRIAATENHVRRSRRRLSDEALRLAEQPLEAYYRRRAARMASQRHISIDSPEAA